LAVGCLNFEGISHINRFWSAFARCGLSLVVLSALPDHCGHFGELAVPD